MSQEIAVIARDRNVIAVIGKAKAKPYR